jgi:hypothetical protein
MVVEDDEPVHGLQFVDWNEVGQKPEQDTDGKKNRDVSRHWRETLGQNSGVASDECRRALLAVLWPDIVASGQFRHSCFVAIVDCEVTKFQSPEWADASGVFVRPEQCRYRHRYACRGWMKVICHRVIRPKDIPKHFPVTHELTSWPEYKAPDLEVKWFVAVKNPPRLVLYCYQFQNEPFEIHNNVMTQSELKKFMKS